MVTIAIAQGDITQLAVDAIVNAANSSLLGGGGVDGAIHRAGGPAILEACRAIVARQGSLPTGEAVITTGGRLPARYVIHTVGPVYRPGAAGLDVLLGNCYRNALRLAIGHGLATVAFPNISTGVYGYPKDEACRVAVGAVREVLAEETGSLREVKFVCFDVENYELYRREIGK
jgi:O-acetyl-ADP-ribose deacetylase (regulator of RNase III)